METKEDSRKVVYLRLTKFTIIAITLVELLAISLSYFFETNTAITLHYYAVFLNLMMLGGVFFKQRALWEIDESLCPSYDNGPILSTYLLIISYIIVVLFFVVFALSFFGFWETKIPVKFQHLFGVHALISGIVLLLLTIIGQIMRYFESEESEAETHNFIEWEDPQI